MAWNAGGRVGLAWVWRAAGGRCSEGGPGQTPALYYFKALFLFCMFSEVLLPIRLEICRITVRISFGSGNPAQSSPASLCALVCLTFWSVCSGDGGGGPVLASCLKDVLLIHLLGRLPGNPSQCPPLPVSSPQLYTGSLCRESRVGLLRAVPWAPVLTFTAC